MPRKPVIDDLRFVKTYNADNLREAIWAFAQNQENVGMLIDRAVSAGLGTRKQVRAAIYLGSKTVNRRFKLEKPE